MAKRAKGRPRPPRAALRSTVGRRPRHTTVGGLRARPALKPSPARPQAARKPGPRASASARRQAARIIDPDEATLLDIVDNLLSKGVVLNADVILALANVDLVYLRLSALLCAADRVLPLRSR
jgi:hypothetical protein